MDLKGRTIWITGASSGIGEALAYVLSPYGVRLILSSRRQDELEQVAGQCRQQGAQAEVKVLDLADSEAITEVSHHVLERYDGLDVLINNGGISQRGSVHESRLEVERRLMEVNFTGQIALTKAVLPWMLDAGRGHIVAVSSVLGLFAVPNRAAYVASKHALQGYFEALRYELHGTGVGVTTVSPGFVRTNVSVNALKADGTLYGIMDEGQQKGVSSEYCARRIIKAVEKGRPQALIGGKELIAVYLKRFFPRIWDRLAVRLAR